MWEDPHDFRLERFMGRDVDFVRDKEWFDMLPLGVGKREYEPFSLLFHCFEWSVEGDLHMTEGPGLSMFRSAELVSLPCLRGKTCL